MMHLRRAKLERFFTAHNLDAILFSHIPNVRYLSGFSGSEASLVITGAWRCILLCDSRYTIQATRETSDCEVRQFSDKLDTVRELAGELHLTRIGIEGAHTTIADFGVMSSKLDDCELVALKADLDQIRLVKDQDEIDRLELVARLASDSLLETLDKLGSGISEAVFACELEFEMRRRGAEGRAFDFIVASGERGSMPHGRASDKLIRSGELVTIDFGALMNGYHSDETVTVAVGRPDPRALQIYAVVKDAHDRALSAVRPGISCRELDSLARNVIRDSGFGEYYGHGLGHGLGLEIHEKPAVSPRGDMTIEEGMVFTIEPGIYIPGLGGVRIEDSVVVQKDGCRLLTQVPKDLIYI